MTTAHLLSMAKKYFDYVSSVGATPVRVDVGKKASELTHFEKLNHVAWMCEHIEKFVAQGEIEKAHRWLGFSQGMMFEFNLYTIDDLRSHNEHKEIP